MNSTPTGSRFLWATYKRITDRYCVYMAIGKLGSGNNYSGLGFGSKILPPVATERPAKLYRAHYNGWGISMALDYYERIK